VENIYVYCVREKSSREGPVYFTIRTDADGNPTRTIFRLGPFLDLDEATLVESQLHNLSSEFRVQRERLYGDLLQFAGFWQWVHAQILPICVYEEVAFSVHPGRASRLDRRAISSQWRTKDSKTNACDSLKYGEA